MTQGPAYGYWQPPVPVSPAGQPLSDFGRRFAAFIIDYLIVGVAGSVLILPLLFFTLRRAGFPDEGPSDTNFLAPMVTIVLAEAATLAIFVALQYLYLVELVVRMNGQTLGKRMLRIRAVPLAPGARMTRGVAARRFALIAAGALVSFLPLIDGLWQLWDKPFRQCLHDKVADTVVVLD